MGPPYKETHSFPEIPYAKKTMASKCTITIIIINKTTTTIQFIDTITKKRNVLDNVTNTTIRILKGR